MHDSPILTPMWAAPCASPEARAADFGGNPADVTLLGWSDGALSSRLLVTSSTDLGAPIALHLRYRTPSWSRRVLRMDPSGPPVYVNERAQAFLGGATRSPRVRGMTRPFMAGWGRRFRTASLLSSVSRIHSSRTPRARRRYEVPPTGFGSSSPVGRRPINDLAQCAGGTNNRP